jgi:hypothetical protein
VSILSTHYDDRCQSREPGNREKILEKKEDWPSNASERLMLLLGISEGCRALLPCPLKIFFLIGNL